jgi:non-specific serine/threonine protein kinase
MRILASSREGLGIGGEATYRVPSLGLPDLSDLPPIDTLDQYEAVKLFIDRAIAAVPTFTVTKENAPALAQVCHHLDGIPLAIELAAAKLRVLSVEQIAKRLDDRFRLLIGGSRTALERHQTLRAAIDWSYNLLSPSEQVLFQRLSVFVGGWTLEASESVCEGSSVKPEDVLDLMEQLINKSLMITEEVHHESRYQMLETLRQYANERLVESTESDVLRNKHLEYFLNLSETAEPKLQSGEQNQWLDKLETEHNNIRAALDWSQAEQQRAGIGLRMMSALWYFWEVRGYLREARSWLEQALEKSINTPAWVRAKALSGMGTIRFDQGDMPQAIDYHQKALEIYQELGDRTGIAFSLNNLGGHAGRHGDYEQAMRFFEESLALYAELEGTRGMIFVLNNLGITTRDLGDQGRAADFYERSLALARQLGEKRLIAVLLGNLGELARDRRDHAKALAYFDEALPLVQKLGDRNHYSLIRRILGDIVRTQGDLLQASDHFRESLRLCRELGDLHSLAQSLVGLARVAGAGDNPKSAARLFSAAESLRRSNDEQLPPAEQAEYDQDLATLRARLGEAGFAQAWAAGETMTLKQVFELAESQLILTHPVTPDPEMVLDYLPSKREAEKQKYGGLTSREREVAAQIAQGKSNQAIAAELFVGLKTVEAHVTRILSKLGFTSRAQIAGWAVAKGLAKAPQDLDTLGREGS